LKVADKAAVRLVTSKGTIVVELNPKAAPLHARSFAYLAGRKFFDGTVFHRYEPGFVIQGGDPLTKDPKLKSSTELVDPDTRFHASSTTSSTSSSSYPPRAARIPIQQAASSTSHSKRRTFLTRSKLKMVSATQYLEKS
jgi:cyclophilin family peptidyl-prolyl cis-trans isomerase